MMVNISHNHPRRKATPPMGVMAPSHFIPVVAMTYRLPEKRMIPTKNPQPAIEKDVSLSKCCIPPTANKAMV